MEPALDLEVLCPLLARDEFGDTAAQRLEEVVVAAHGVDSSLNRYWHHNGRHWRSVEEVVARWRGRFDRRGDAESRQVTRRQLITEIRAAHRAFVERRPAQVGTDQLRVERHGAQQVRAAKVGARGVGPGEVGESEVATRKIGEDETGSSKGNTPQVQSRELGPREIGASEVHAVTDQ